MANSNGWGDGSANNAIGWGQGANNAIGWGDIHADSWAGLTDIVGITTPPVDPDAEAFITAAAITDPTQQSAINQLVVDLKGYSIWSKMKALYPFVGSTASQHKWNLKDPRDLDAAFRLVFSGGGAWTVNGYTPNGTNGYANTFLTPSTTLSATNVHISTYIRTASQGVLMGTDNSFRLWIASNFNGTNKYFELNSLNATARTPISNSLGLWAGNKTPSDSFSNQLWLNGVLNDSFSKVYDGLDTLPIVIGGRRTGASTVSNYVSSQIAFSAIGDGLTDTEAANFYTAVQAFQTTLGRNV
jgi:hypothetical protein